jgi:hypothetical protein
MIIIIMIMIIIIMMMMMIIIVMMMIIIVMMMMMTMIIIIIQNIYKAAVSSTPAFKFAGRATAICLGGGRLRFAMISLNFSREICSANLGLYFFSSSAKVL